MVAAGVRARRRGVRRQRGVGRGSQPARQSSRRAAGGQPNPEAICEVPAEAGLADVSSPTTVVGTGTPASCTGDAFVDAVAEGGVITFDCGPDPVTITLDETAKIFNDTGPEIVIDGGGMVTLSGGGQRRILYMNTCDEAQHWTTRHCDDQDHPRLTRAEPHVRRRQREGRDARATAAARSACAAAASRSSTRASSTTCARTPAPTSAAPALRVLSQFERPAGVRRQQHVRRRGGLRQRVLERRRPQQHRRLVDHHQQPVLAQPGDRQRRQPGESGTPGGGSGGAIYNDGNTMTLSTCAAPGSRTTRSTQHGSAIFFVSNDHSGDIRIEPLQPSPATSAARGTRPTSRSARTTTPPSSSPTPSSATTSSPDPPARRLSRSVASSPPLTRISRARFES